MSGGQLPTEMNFTEPTFGILYLGRGGTMAAASGAKRPSSNRARTARRV
jgi:hypothetical protein